MKPNAKFVGKPGSFWACVRSISQTIGYGRGETILQPSVKEMVAAFEKLDLDPEQIFEHGSATRLACELEAYFAERANALVRNVRPKLMNADQARELYMETIGHFDRYDRRDIISLRNFVNEHHCPIPMNKQRGDKRDVAFLTALVNMMIERHVEGLPCDYDPHRLVTMTRGRAPLRTMSRRVDGAFPSTIDPIAVWEIKEYYHTTTFGSRVADGVYETLLDGMEIEEMHDRENIDVRHYLMVDGYFTWWDRGKSYLCRMFDMLHMGYVDEILFGREVVEEMPRIVSEWVAAYRREGR